MSDPQMYRGVITPHGYIVTTPEGEPLPLRLDLRDHSPTGFNSGYGGSGPAQLALALLAHCLGDKVALEYYQDFKWRIVASLPSNSWTLTPKQIREAVQAITEERE